MTGSLAPRALFVALEGGEGSGKTTLARTLAAHLRENGLDCELTREPGGYSAGAHGVGTALRGVLLDPAHASMAQMTELLLFLAARAQNIHETIVPAHGRGAWVICDRYMDSTLAYQAFGRGMDRGLVQQLCEIAQGGITPDVTLYLDIDPRIGLQRAARAKGGLDRFDGESIAFHERVRAGFLQLFEEGGVRFSLDAHLTPEAIASQALQILQRLSGERGRAT